MQINLPEQVRHIIKHLTVNGFEAYAVGGCIRDTILGKIPGDWDITTSATPYEVKALFRRTVDTGIQHGTVLVLIEEEGYEVTTYRIDGDYEDNRHPKEVSFTKTLHEDLKRRDFTINAMAYNEERGLIDEFGGIQDIKEQKIRCVGNPLERFQEDALRILRAFRFSAQLGFKIETNTLAAATKYAINLETISSERIRDEINKLLLSNAPERMIDVYQAGITPYILPEFDRMMKSVKSDDLTSNVKIGEYSLFSIKQAKQNLKLRLSLFFHLLLPGDPESSANESKSILQRLHFDNETISIVSRVIQHQNLTEQMLSPNGMRKTIYLIGEDLMELLFDFWDTLVTAESLRTKNATSLLKQKDNLKRAKSFYYNILANKDCTNLKTLAISGKDLIQLGYSPGKELGSKLQELLELVLEQPEKNKKELLLEMAQFP